MSENYFAFRTPYDSDQKVTRIKFLSKSWGWTNNLADALPFSSRDAAKEHLHGRHASVWPESEIKASDYYQAQMKRTSSKPTTNPKPTDADESVNALPVPGTKKAKSAFLAVQKKGPKWHKQVAAELIKEFRETNELSEKARHRRLRLGFMFLFVKEMGKEDESIPHGQFVPWLEANCPAIPRRTSTDYMTEAKSVCELVGWQVADVIKLKPHKLLGSASESDRKKHEKFFEIINQKGSFRAVTEYKQVDEETGQPRVGRLPGHGGASKEQRVNADERERQERLTERKLKAVEISEWLTEMSDDKGFGEIFGAPELIQLDLAMETARGYIRHGAPEPEGAQ